MLNRYPFELLPTALILLRVSVAILIWAHAAVRITNGTIARHESCSADGMLPAKLA